MDEDVLDAAETLLSYLDDHDEVAYATVGGVSSDRVDAVVTHDRTRNVTRIPETGVWCRAYADGAAGYRYTTTLDEDALIDVADRALRSGKHLGQDEPAMIDPATVHRSIHRGWADRPLDSRTPDEQVAPIEAVRDEAVDAIDLDRARFEYRGEHLDEVTMTTAGSAIRSTLDRFSVDVTLVAKGGQRVDRHVGSTEGEGAIDTLTGTVEEAVDCLDRLESLDRTTVSSDEDIAIVLGPRAAGQLIHALSAYFEIDAVYMGSSPFELGDRIGPALLTIHDTIEPGSWAARAYDAEARAATPRTLVDDGRVRQYMHSTASAAVDDAMPAGNLIPSLGYDTAPRVHARHLAVEAGTDCLDDLLADATAYVERFDRIRVENEATRTKRAGAFPASTLYAKDARERTPSRYDESDQSLSLAVSEGYRIVDGDFVGSLSDETITLDLADLHSIDGVTAGRETVTGTTTKHTSRLPYAVTAPAIRLRTRFE